MLNVGANDPGGILRTQGEALATITLGASAILPRVHLFRDDVCLFTNAAGEELRHFEDGGADLAEAVARKDGAGGSFYVIPKIGIRGE
jgi:hypothetical protein